MPLLQCRQARYTDSGQEIRFVSSFEFQISFSPRRDLDFDFPSFEPLMLSIPAHAIRTCEGVSRREWLRIGGLGTLGLGLPLLAAGRAQSAETAGEQERS